MQVEFVDIILPLTLPKAYTYRVPKELTGKLKIGQRVVVQFGRGKKKYSGIIANIHDQPPQTYQAKYIEAVLDDRPIVNQKQLKLWEWTAEYYLANIGEVMAAALPSALKLASETKVLINPEFTFNGDDLTDNEFLICEALEVRNSLTLQEISEITNLKNVHHLVKSLIDKKAILVEEELKRKFKPKTAVFVRLTKAASNDDNLKLVFDELNRAPKQMEALLKFIDLSKKFEKQKKEVRKTDLQNKAGVSSSVINALVDKGVFELYEKVIGRLYLNDEEDNIQKDLSSPQSVTYKSIKEQWKEKDVVLLNGVTSSGKTEIYIHLINDALKQNKQVLYLLPEIALTTQIINRLKNIFGNKVGVYHSKFNENERVEIWNKVLDDADDYRIILGARSAIFLPFNNLGLVIVDEEHENTFKQFDPAPRYNARDLAVVLSQIHNNKVLLGSATPSIESYYNAQTSKYGYVELTERYGNVQLPEIICVDVKEATRKKKMKSHFSPQLYEEMKNALENKKQIILFQNRRGYAPFIICESCGHTPYCQNCDVALTYHKNDQKLKCHYCGYSISLQSTCSACGSNRLTQKGFGTEKIEEELSIFFPSAKVKRMDLDTTRSKNAYQELISAFEEGAIDILVGTQMVTKGLDFDNVSLVGILNADNMLNYPDFRAFERSFQLMLQVSGRAGRKNARGKVMIQTYNPDHPIIKKVIQHDYKLMAEEELIERKKFKYPPFYRLIKITLKHKDFKLLNQASVVYANQLKSVFGNQRVLGPEYPVVTRIRNYFLKCVVLKIEKNADIKKFKKELININNSFLNNKHFNQVYLTLDVDPQ